MDTAHDIELSLEELATVAGQGIGTTPWQYYPPDPIRPSWTR